MRACIVGAWRDLRQYVEWTYKLFRYGDVWA